MDEHMTQSFSVVWFRAGKKTTSCIFGSVAWLAGKVLLGHGINFGICVGG
jgi:hypothetical protein